MNRVLGLIVLALLGGSVGVYVASINKPQTAETEESTLDVGSVPTLDTPVAAQSEPAPQPQLSEDKAPQSLVERFADLSQQQLLVELVSLAHKHPEQDVAELLLALIDAGVLESNQLLSDGPQTIPITPLYMALRWSPQMSTNQLYEFLDRGALVMNELSWRMLLATHASEPDMAELLVQQMAPYPDQQLEIIERALLSNNRVMFEYLRDEPSTPEISPESLEQMVQSMFRLDLEQMTQIPNIAEGDSATEQGSTLQATSIAALKRRASGLRTMISRCELLLSYPPLEARLRSAVTARMSELQQALEQIQSAIKQVE